MLVIIASNVGTFDSHLVNKDKVSSDISISGRICSSFLYTHSADLGILLQTHSLKACRLHAYMSYFYLRVIRFPRHI